MRLTDRSVQLPEKLNAHSALIAIDGSTALW